MKKQYVTKEQELKLPKASLFKFSIYRFWFVMFWRWITRTKTIDGYPAPKPKWYFKIRGANFTSRFFGPINLTHRSRWLKMSAETLYKNRIS